MNLQEFDKFIEKRKFFTEDFEKELRKRFENEVVFKNGNYFVILTKDFSILIETFENKFDEGKFVTFVSQYLDSVVSKNSNISQSEPFLINELKITATIKTPSRLYDFIDALRSYENVVKIDFPIEMQKDGDKISAAFNVKIYGLR